MKLSFRSQDYLVQGGSGTQPGLVPIGHSAQPGLSSASQPRTCPSKPQEQQPSVSIWQQLHTQGVKKALLYLCVYIRAGVCVVTRAAEPCLWCVWESVILPDYVAGLGKAACHKEAFDDVNFLIHGLRQAGGNWDSQKSEERQNAKRLRSPASTNSMFNPKCKRKHKKTQQQLWWKKN